MNGSAGLPVDDSTHPTPGYLKCSYKDGSKDPTCDRGDAKLWLERLQSYSLDSMGQEAYTS